MLYSRDVGESLVVPGGAKVIDAHKKYVMPGNLWLINCIIYLSRYATSHIPKTNPAHVSWGCGFGVATTPYVFRYQGYYYYYKIQYSLFGLFNTCY